jgi:hypothetical protein
MTDLQELIPAIVATVGYGSPCCLSGIQIVLSVCGTFVVISTYISLNDVSCVNRRAVALAGHWWLFRRGKQRGRQEEERTRKRRFSGFGELSVDREAKRQHSEDSNN